MNSARSCAVQCEPRERLLVSCSPSLRAGGALPASAGAACGVPTLASASSASAAARSRSRSASGSARGSGSSGSCAGLGVVRTRFDADGGLLADASAGVAPPSSAARFLLPPLRGVALERFGLGSRVSAPGDALAGTGASPVCADVMSASSSLPLAFLGRTDLDLRFRSRLRALLSSLKP